MLDLAHVRTEAGALLLPSSIPNLLEELESGDMNLWTCIGLDPGGTTGWCVFSVHDIAMRSDEYRILENVHNWSAGEVTGSIEHQIDVLVDLVEAWPDAEIVCESFFLRQLSGGPELLDPVRITQPIKWWLESGSERAWAEDEEWKPRYMAFQQPGLAMSSVTDERLKAFGVLHLTAGKPHARDALRHAITYARRRKDQMMGVS